jgi:hypothetical protein
MQTATVKYQVATYSGNVKVFNVDPNDDDENIVARAKEQLTRSSGGSLPYGYQSFRVVSRVCDGTEE